MQMRREQEMNNNPEKNAAAELTKTCCWHSSIAYGYIQTGRSRSVGGLAMLLNSFTHMSF